MQEFIVELTTTVPEGAEQSEVDTRWAADNVRIKELEATVPRPGSGVSPAWCRTPEIAR